MSFLKCSLISIVSWLFIVNGAFAESKEAAGHAEPAKKEGKGSGGLPEWVELQGKLQALKGKIKAKEDNINKLMLEKMHVRDAKRAAAIVLEMKAEHKELKDSAEEYNKSRNLLKYRFPEKGLVGERQYKRVEIKSMKEIENQFSIEGRLTGTLGRVRKQYKQPEVIKKSTQKAEAEAAAAAEEAEESGHSKILEPAVISK